MKRMKSRRPMKQRGLRGLSPEMRRKVAAANMTAVRNRLSLALGRY